MAPIAALMYAVAGGVVGASVLLPHPAAMNEQVILALACSGLLAASLIWLCRHRLPPWFFQLSTAAGSALTGMLVYWGGEASSPYAWLMLWIAVFSAYFFTAGQTIFHLGLAGLIYAWVLAIHPEPDSDVAAHWLLTVVALGVAAGIIRGLVSSRRRLERERELLLSETMKLARTDHLTGLANRRAFGEQLDREIARSRRQDKPLCVAMIDIDHFKRYNDEHGHIAGDELLQEMARAWIEMIRPSDILARHGGEEFALLLPECGVEAAMVVVARIRASTPADQRCSAGLACWDGLESPLELISRADMRLYEAKELGRDRVVIDVPAPV